MSEFTEKLHVTAVGCLCPADIGGEACEGCQHNKNGDPAVLLTGCTKEAAALLFEDCRIIPAGTDNEPETNILLERQAKRIKELEAENAGMRNEIAINTHFRAERKSKYGELLQAVWAHCDRCDGRARGLCQTCGLVGWRPPEEKQPGFRELRTVQVGDWDEVPGDE